MSIDAGKVSAAGPSQGANSSPLGAANDVSVGVGP